MIAPQQDELVEADALITLFGAVVRKALADYAAGPGYTTTQHNDYLSARAFLLQAHLLCLDDPDEELLVDDLM